MIRITKSKLRHQYILNNKPIYISRKSKKLLLIKIYPSLTMRSKYLLKELSIYNYDRFRRDLKEGQAYNVKVHGEDFTIGGEDIIKMMKTESGHETQGSKGRLT